MASNLNFALAVSIEGEFVGYVSSIEELQSILADVNRTASGVLEYECDLSSEISYSVAVGTAQENINKVIEDKLYENIEDIADLALVCVGGKAVCAYETKTEALEAIESLKGKYVNENTVSAEFAETVSVIEGYGNKRLLACQDELARGSLLKIVTIEKTTTKEPIMYETIMCLRQHVFRRVCDADRGAVRRLRRTTASHA
jgi:hypothetical protein